MKRSALLIVMLCMRFLLFPQSKTADSLRVALEKKMPDTNRVILLCQLSHAYQGSRPDSALLLAQQAYFMSKTEKYIKGEGWAFSEMAFAFNSLGNSPRALEYYIRQLKIEESRGYADNIATVYLNIALLYDNNKDYESAIVYAKLADSIIRVNHYENLSLYSLLDIGEIYEKKNELDSALFYTNRCQALSVKAGNDLITGTALNNLGNIYYKSHNFKVAFDHYKSALPFLLEFSDYANYAESLLGLSHIFEQSQQMDSAIGYGKKSFEISSGNQFLNKAMDASSYLSKLYKKTGNLDSAFAFEEITVGLRDSIDSREKIKKLQSLTTEEELRQKEIAKLKLDEIRDRREKLQLLSIGIAIPIFFLMSVVISKRKVHKRLIEWSGIISILLLFEYITLLIHPFIAERTDHSPLAEIVIFVTIAAIITPSHHRIQHWLIEKLTRLNYVKHHKPEESQNDAVDEKVTD